MRPCDRACIQSLCICQKRPIYLAKETYIYVSKETYTHIKKRPRCRVARPMTRDNESRDIIHMSKETYLRAKRDLCTSQTRHMYMILLASTVHDSRWWVTESYIESKETIFMSKETYIHVGKNVVTEKRGPWLDRMRLGGHKVLHLQKRPICLSKETYIHVEKDVLTE